MKREHQSNHQLEGLFNSLFPEIGPEKCESAGCGRKRIRSSVLCAVHEFQKITGRDCPWDRPTVHRISVVTRIVVIAIAVFVPAASISAVAGDIQSFGGSILLLLIGAGLVYFGGEKAEDPANIFEITGGPVFLAVGIGLGLLGLVGLIFTMVKSIDHLIGHMK